ncbi:acylphosphatase [Patescibacteria group bacterium]|nr:acylphosphatase [Patescibacteria group bacterium]
MKHLGIIISGLVQGVSFRYFAKEQADSLSIFGLVKNLDNGRVYIEVEGTEDNLKKFVAWCQSGPGLAKVENVKIVENKLKNFINFKIEH